MSGLARDKFIPLVERDLGDITYPIWLLINPKYPTVVNDIWRHVLDEIQDHVYRKINSRIDTSNIYIRSVVSDCGIVPNTLNWWGKEVATEIKLFREILLEYQPKILVTFGGFPYEFVRRVFEVKPEKGPKYWSANKIKNEFDRSIKTFDVNNTNLIPLLRRVTIERNDRYDCFSSNEIEDYFQQVGKKISEIIIRDKNSLKIWIPVG
ncbi:hypothetical protein [Desulfosporosinus hippei]|uniref:Uracil DNA glycosylase superfamily protein n=1 Tax=Desulfosporosinus hippei DSM 8344 TaxID=1121419 RepID=A0A1G8EHH7_9FIRM|nr:hypothetical protein [Desulfosporosinus hippei]SDH69326.1 hypothetical protein SAMN05443529_11724 [Desulfosporosinus hippei DSM 8344]